MRRPRTNIGQSAAVTVDGSRNKGLGLTAADADDVGIGGRSCVTNVNVATAGGDVVARIIAQGDVVGATCVEE